ncbi:hypothetical protein EEJ42_14635, partial [Streptomyces botrytidirepellens]
MSAQPRSREADQSAGSAAPRTSWFHIRPRLDAANSTAHRAVAQIRRITMHSQPAGGDAGWAPSAQSQPITSDDTAPDHGPFAVVYTSPHWYSQTAPQ